MPVYFLKNCPKNEGLAKIQFIGHLLHGEPSVGQQLLGFRQHGPMNPTNGMCPDISRTTDEK